MAAKKKPLETKPAQLGEVRVTVKSMELPPERPAGRIIGRGIGRRARARPPSPDRSEGALMANVLVFAETRGTTPRKVALEAVTAGARARRRDGRRRGARGARGAGRHRRERRPARRRHGADVVFVAEHEGVLRDTRARRSRRPSRSARSRWLSRRGARVLGAGARSRSAARGEARRAHRLRRDGDSRVAGDTITVKHPGIREQGDRHARRSRHRPSCLRSPRRVSPRRRRPKRGRTESDSARGRSSAARVVVKEVIEGAKGSSISAKRP